MYSSEKDKNTWTLYVHKNKANGKCYVGITGREPEKRWRNGFGYCGQVFYKAIQKYGWDGFEHIILEQNLSYDKACELEIQKIKELHSLNTENGYNVGSGGATGEMNKTHGDTGNRLYAIWYNIKWRLKENKSKKHYLQYFPTNSIRLCDEWHDYLTFKEWALSHGYDEGKKLYRIDCNGNFDPDNCAWGTHSEQTNHRKSCTYITYKGETKSIMEWCRETCMLHRTLSLRYHKGLRGDDLFKPVMKSMNRRGVPIIAICPSGEEMVFESIKDASLHFGISATTIARISKTNKTKNGFSFKRESQERSTL